MVLMAKGRGDAEDSSVKGVTVSTIIRRSYWREFDAIHPLHSNTSPSHVLGSTGEETMDQVVKLDIIQQCVQ